MNIPARVETAVIGGIQPLAGEEVVLDELVVPDSDAGTD
jgi:hypothetical protein